MGIGQHAVSVVLVFLVLSVLNRIMMDGSLRNNVKHASDLLQRTMHWSEMATQDREAAVRLQHSAMAMAYLDAARSMSRDDELERACGVDVDRLAKTVDDMVTESRRTLRAHKRVRLTEPAQKS